MTTKVLRLGMDTRGMESGQGRAVRALSRVRSGARETARESDGLSGALDRTGGRMRQVATVAATLGLALGVAGLAGELRTSIQASSSFESSLVQLNTLVGLSQQEVSVMGQEIRVLSRDLGITAQEMSSAAFAITSGGARGAEAMEILEQSAKAAAIGLGDTRDIGRLAGAAVQAFGAQGLTASEAIDIMVATIREGNLEASELANVMGSAMGPASALGITMEEVGGFIATYTRLGVSAAEATTSLQAAMTLAISPTQQARDAMAAAGFSVDQFRAAIQDDGLANALVQLIAATDGNIDRLGEFIPNVRALRGILGTAGVQGEEFERIVASIGDSVGITNEGFETWGETSEATFARFNTAVEAARLEFGGRFLPLAIRGIQGLTENLELATDAAIALSAALATLVALRVGIWAAGAVTAFTAWAGAAGSLALGVRSLSAALALLKVAIGPTGWLLLGLGVITSGVFAWRRANRDAEESIGGLDSAMAGMNETLEEQVRLFGELTDAQLLNQIAQREARADQIRGNIAELEARLNVGAPGGTLDNLQAQRDALAAEEETIARINGLLVDRNRLEGVSTGRVGARGSAQAQSLDALREEVTLLTSALELDINRASILAQATSSRDQINARIAAGVSSLEEEVALTRERNRLNDAMTENVERRIGLSEDEVKIVGELQVGTLEWENATERVASALGWTREEASAFMAEVTEGASGFETNWLAAINIVGSSLGGLASQITNVVTAFATGGPVAGIAAAVGGALGFIRGRRSDRADEEAARRMAEEMERAAEALQRFTDALSDDLSVRRLVIAGMDEEAERRRQDLQARSQADDLLERLRDRDPTGSLAAGLEVFDISSFLGLDPDELDAMLADLRAAGGEYESLLADWIELHWVQAREMDALIADQERRAQERLEREAEQERRRILQEREFARELAMMRADLAGDDRRLLELELEQQAESRIAQAEDLLRAGTITQEAFDELVDLLGLRVARALEDYDDGLRRQAEALEMATLGFERGIDLMQMEIDGRDEAMFRLQRQMEMERALADARERGISDDLIDRWRDTFEDLTDVLVARRFDDAIGGRAGRASRAAGDSAVARATTFTVSQAHDLIDIGRTHTSILHGIERNTSVLRRDLGGFPSAGAPAGARVIQISVPITIENLGDLTPEQGRQAGRGIAEEASRAIASETNRIEQFFGGG